MPLPGGGSVNQIPERAVSRSPLRRHPRENRHEVIDIVDNENLYFTSMLPVKSTDILANVPFHEMGIVKNSVSNLGSSKPSPM